MITLHHEKETDFTKNGFGDFSNAIINPEVSWEMNGEFKITFEYPLFELASFAAKPRKEIIENLTNRNIVRAPVPYMDDQLFRIYRTKEVLGYIQVEARHIFYDLIDNLIEDTNVVGKNGLGALTQLLNATQYTHKFKAFSDIDSIRNMRIVRYNPVKALLDDSEDNTYVNRWGGELYRDNYNIHMRKRLGTNRGVRIEHKKDLLGYEATIDESTIATRIMPKGFDGLLLPEKYVDSPLLDPDNPKIRVIEYSDVKAAIDDYADDEDALPIEEAYAELRRLVKAEYSTHHVDEPETIIHVDFVTLENTKEYEEFSELQEIHQGDTVQVSVPEQGFEITSRLVAFTSDPLRRNHYTSTTLGNHVLEYTTSRTEIDVIRKEIKNTNEIAIIARQAANSRNTNYWGTVDPNTVELNAQLGDTYFQEDGDYFAIWEYVEVNGERYWRKGPNTDFGKEISNQLKDAIEEIEKMDDQIQTNDKKAQNAYEAATGAKNLAESHKQILEELGEDTLRFNHFVDTIDSTVRTIADDEYISQSVQASGIIQNEVSKIEIGGRNLIPDSNNFKKWTNNYQGNVATIEEGVVVEEWQATDATKIISDGGGNSSLRLYHRIDNTLGLNLTWSMWIKNVGQNRIRARINEFRNSIGNVHIQPGESKRVIITGTARTSHDWIQAMIDADNATDRVEFIVWREKIERGTKATDWTPAPEDQENYTDTAVRTVQTQLDNSWAVKTLNDAGDVLSQLNVNSGGVKISGDLVYIDSPEMIADGIITNSLLAKGISADKITVGKLFGNDVTANGINVNTIVGLNSSFLRTTWNGINTAIQIDPEYIRVHGTKGRKAYITPLAEFRSDAANGKYILMGNGRIQAYAPDVGALFILGSDLYNIKPEGQLGVMHRRRFAIGRYDRYSTDEGTPQLNPYIELGFWKDQSGYRDRNGMIRIHKPIMFEYRDNITGVGTLNAEQLIVANGGYLRPDTSAGKYLSRLALGGSQGISFGVMTTSSYSRKAYIDNTHMYMFVTLSMEGRSITNVGSIGPRSERKYKKHIKPLKRVRDTIMSMNIYSYIKRGEFELGIMADEAPKEVLMPDEKSINLYSYASMLGKGLQEAFEEIDKIREVVAELKGVK